MPVISRKSQLLISLPMSLLYKQYAIIGRSDLLIGQQQTTPQCFLLDSENQIIEFSNYVIYVGLREAEFKINFSDYLCWVQSK